MADDGQIAPGRDPEYPSQIWMNPKQCPHPYEYVRLNAGSFPPSDPERLSVFKVDCFACGMSWDQTNAAPWIYEYLAAVIAEGKFTVVSRNGLDITGRVEWERQTRYGSIMKDLAGSGNPIAESSLNSNDLLAKFDH